MALTAGTRLGPYEIATQIGKGGMGEVYRATDTNLKRAVAIKVLPESVATDRDRLLRFQREAEVLASLNHPNIAAIYGLERSDGITALVMELVEGPTLADRIVQGPIPIDEALPIAKQIAGALEAAHEQGIIHRDLKPANIKLRPDGTVKVLDFGLAKAFEPASARADATASPTITSPAMMTGVGVLLGTAAYMSPEQARGKAVDKRSDIWAFGCVLYEMLTGRRTFEGDDVSDTLANVLKTDPQWRALPAGTPTSVRWILHRCLAKDPRRRLADVTDARLELEEPAWGEGDTRQDTSAERPPAWPIRVWLTALVVGVAVAIAMVVILQWRDADPVTEPRPIAFSIEPPEGTSFVTTTGLTLGLAPQIAVSPNGAYLAFIAMRQGRTALWVRELSNVSARQVPGTDGASHPFWSPDGRFIAFFADGKLKRVPRDDGGSPMVICDVDRGWGGTWNNQDVIVFGASGGANSGALRRVAASGGLPTDVTKIDAGAPEFHLWPQFLPNGREFLYYKRNQFATAAIETALEFRIGSLNGGQDLVLPLRGNDLSSFVRYASGRLLFARARTLFAQPFDVESRQLSGEPVPVAENVAVSGDRYGSFSASDTGVLMYGLAPPVESRLVWKDRMGRELGSIGPPGGYTNLSLSPDDQRVAVSLSSGNPPNRDIWTIDLRTSATARLTFDRTSEMFPTWSPDGSVVAFIGGDPAAGRRYNLSLRDSAGRGAEQILIENEQPDRVSRPLISDWADDGRHVVFTQANMITGDLWILPVMMDRDTATGALPRPSGKPRPFIQSEFSEDSATFAPGSRWMAYQSNVNGTWEVFVEPFPSTGERHQVSRGGGSQPLWRRDGQELFFIAPTGEMMAVPVRIGPTFQSGTPHALFASGTDQTVGANRQTYAVTRDGQRFLINVPQRGGSPPLTALVNWQTMTRQR